MNILITGGAGFIGSALATRLVNEGVNVIVADRFDNPKNLAWKEQNIEENLGKQNYKLYRGDICEKEFVEKIFKENSIDVVAHLAAKAGVRKSLEEPLEYLKSNIEGTINVLESMKKHNVKKVVFSSSSIVYGDNNAETLSEDMSDFRPKNPYSFTKIACEQILYMYSYLYEMSVVCLRLFTVYGPRQRHDLAMKKFIDQIKHDQTVTIYGDGNTIRDYNYIDDIVSGFCAAINYDKTPFEIINLGNSKPVSISELISVIESILGKKAKIEYMPKHKGDAQRNVSNNKKAKELLNYKPMTDLYEGIKKTINE